MKRKDGLTKANGIGQILVTFIIYSFAQGLFMINAKKLKLVTIVYIFGLTIALLSLTYGIYQRRLNQQNPWHFTSYNKSRLPKFTWKNWGYTVLGFLVICSLQVLAGFLINGQATNQEIIVKQQQSLNPIINVMLVVIAPLFEEIIF
ncbi:hypothetical protein [Lactobacillus xujianguonis]|nr:hypothetical protein [Lactobacillus xujianguonis]